MRATTTLRGLLASAAALAAATAVAAPARADDAPAKISQVLPSGTLAAGTSTDITPYLFADRRVTLTNATTTFELSGSLDGVALANQDQQPRACDTDGTQKITCTDPYFPFDLEPNSFDGRFTVKLSATKAALGESGKLTITLTADGIEPVVTVVDVNIAEAVDLQAGKNSSVTTKPGGTFDAALSVHNNAGTAAHGAAVIFDTDYALQTTKKFSNCLYDGDRLNACVFDQDLAAGRSYGLTVPYRARKDSMAPGGAFGEFVWLTSDDYADMRKFRANLGAGSLGTAGNGAKLELTQLPSVRSLVKQTDPDVNNSTQEMRVAINGKNGIDFAAVGATFTGKTGDTVPVTVGVRNIGPAVLDLSRPGEPAAVVLVTPPTGTSVATIPAGCRKDDGMFPAKNGAARYLCLSEPILKVGAEVTWTFQLKVNKATENALGSVEVNPACNCEVFAGDTAKANDTAKIVLNPGKSDQGAGQGGDNGDDGGTLPITGSKAGLAGGAGAALVVLGAAGYLLARRRRTRFEA